MGRKALRPILQTTTDLLRKIFSVWSPETIGRDLLLNLVGGLVATIIVFVVARQWELIVSYWRRDLAAFRRMFGWRTLDQGALTVVLDTFRDVRLLPANLQQSLGLQPQVPGPRFFKIFPDGHYTFLSGPGGALLSDATTRGAVYVSEGLRGLTSVSVNLVSDDDVSGRWDGAFVALGSSYSNLRTDDIKHLLENPWLQDDTGTIQLKDGEVIGPDPRADKGFVMKLDNPHVDGHSLVVCAGLGEWGTSGAAWYFSVRWRDLARRFGRKPFLIVVAVTRGSDQSAREILARGQEKRTWPIRRRWRHFRGHHVP